LRKIGLEAPKPKGISLDSTPNSWPNAVDGEALFHDVSSIIRRHVVVDTHSLVATTLWIALSYLIEVVDTLPLLGIISPEKRCGKTRLLAVLRRLVKRSLSSSNISSAALYRAIEKYIPTLIVDEADVVFENNDELRCLFNSGHTRDTAFVLRAERENGDVLSFSTWAPKAIALIGKLPPTLADRSISVSMRRRSKIEKIHPLRKTPAVEFEELQQRLVRWTDDNKTKIAAADPKLPEYLNDRAADNWHPLLAIAEIAGPDWRALALQAMRAMNKADNDEDSVITALLGALRKLFSVRRITQLRAHLSAYGRQKAPPDTFVATNDILTALNADAEAPWADWRQGKGLSAQKLRSILVPFGVYSIQEQISNVRARGYLWTALRPIFERYL
jgi:putative DNA primase/helicase